MSNLLAALAWIDTHGDRDGDGFVEYQRMTERGLANQGWKDSFDSIFHADGTPAEGPIALCEVQAYVFAAKRGAARIARRLGEEDRAAGLEREAEALRQRFEDRFWLDELGASTGARRPQAAVPALVQCRQCLVRRYRRAERRPPGAM